MRPRSRRRRLLGLIGAAFLLGAVTSPPIEAQEDPAALDQLYGGYVLSARSNGLQLTYDSPGLLPTGSPIFQLSIPESLATLSSGPTGYALASFAFPGPLVADLGAALAAGGTDTGIPPYPVRAEANYPGGPEEKSDGAQGTEMTAVTKFGDSRALGSYAGLGASPAVDVGSVRAGSQSVFEEGVMVARTRVEVSDVSILGGLIRIESLVTDLVAATNADEAASDGSTTVTGVTVLGLAAEFVDGHLQFVEAPPADDAPVPGGGPLGGIVGNLAGAVSPLNALLDQVGAQGDTALQTLFEQSGIEVSLFEPIETAEGGAVERTANGLLVRTTYTGATTPVLSQLLAMIPSDQLPANDLGPVPFSPQAIFNLSKETHITAVALAPANVSARATPVFDFPEVEIPITPIPGGGSTSSPSFTDPGTAAVGDFATATPDLPPAPAAQDVAVPIGSGTELPLGDALPAFAVLLVALGTPFLGAGSRRLADRTLAGTVTACPEGLDAPPSGGSP